MREPYADRSFRRRGAVEPRRRVVDLVAPLEHRGQHERAPAGERKRAFRGLCEVDVAGNSQVVQASPYRIREGRVVIARNEDPVSIERLEGVEHPEQGGVGDRVGVERVARDQHGIRVPRRRQPADRANGFDPPVAQGGAGIARNVGELLAQLPVRRVNEAEGHDPASAVVTRPAFRQTADRPVPGVRGSVRSWSRISSVFGGADVCALGAEDVVPGPRRRAGRSCQPFGLNRCSGPGKAPLCTSSAYRCAASARPAPSSA